MMSDIQKVLHQRGQNYGDFRAVAATAQTIKMCWYVNTNLQPYQREALDMIASKLGRIANGDPFHDDSWVDIAGYATLVVEQNQLARSRTK